MKLNVFWENNLLSQHLVREGKLDASRIIPRVAQTTLFPENSLCVRITGTGAGSPTLSVDFRLTGQKQSRISLKTKWREEHTYTYHPRYNLFYHISRLKDDQAQEDVYEFKNGQFNPTAFGISLAELDEFINDAVMIIKGVL